MANNYRLNIDFSLGPDQKAAIKKANPIVEAIVELIRHMRPEGVESIGVRLANDDDRSPKNYLQINENGHASGKKMVIPIVKEQSLITDECVVCENETFLVIGKNGLVSIINKEAVNRATI